MIPPHFRWNSLPGFCLIFASVLACGRCLAAEAGTNSRVRIAIVGLTHDHGFGFIPSVRDGTQVELVGIVETNRALVEAYASSLQLSTNLFFDTVETLMSRTNADAVAVFTSTFDHKAVVEEGVKHGIKTFMLEKPLAVNVEHARAIAAAARANSAEIFVNYETTWYPANHELFRHVVEQRSIGTLRKLVAHHGHPGPRAIGCTDDFVAWLADPVLNGGGALMDFGCYGAVLMTWLMQGERPQSVSAVAQSFQPRDYPKVEDEATLVLTYRGAQGIIQASWNWPHDRKDLELYGTRGSLFAPNSTTLRGRFRGAPEKELEVAPIPQAHANPLAYLTAVARREIKPSGMSSLETNLIVMEILDAARRSIAEGRRIDLPN